VISSHNQYYERTYPLLYNSEDYEDPIYIDDPKSINRLHNPDGIIFLTVGTAGDELQDIIDKEDYYIIQDNDEYGFLNLKLKNNGKTIIGKFHSNGDDEIIDHFEINK
jgi:hypothetical protein